MKVQIKGYISYQKYSWEENPCYVFTSYKPEDVDHALVMPYAFDVDIPNDFDPRHGQVANLQSKKKQAMADFHALVTSIDRQISELTAIECTEAV